MLLKVIFQNFYIGNYQRDRKADNERKDGHW
jgi:hypothetical protein